MPTNFIPKSENLLKVINNFKKVLPRAIYKRNLDMSEVRVNQCGSIHCHAGWYAVATCNNYVGLSFHVGAKQLAKDLELEINYASLVPTVTWANRNPNIWGNKFGSDMFTLPRAFISKFRPAGAKSLQDIIDHWTEVYERVLVLEQQVEISHPPILAEQLIESLESKVELV